MTKQKANKEVIIYQKKCANKECGGEFSSTKKTIPYCPECNREYQKAYREEHKSNYIYIFANVEEQKLPYYIGSTNTIKRRISAHLNGYTDVLDRIQDNKYNIIYAELPKELTRQEREFIEYYLIHKCYLVFGKIPIANVKEAQENDICTSRQLQLIMMAESIQFQKYDILKHKKILI